MLTSRTKLGPYEITGALGAGGMGEVYRARDTRLGRDVALKVLPEAFARDAERMARLRREAQVLASLNHPNIAAIYGFEDSGATHALVMELVEGPTLAERIKSGAIAMDEALPMAKQICEALEYAHERGIIHRDLKPSNVKVTTEGNIKVLDFGLAKAIEGDASAASVENSPTLSAVATRAGFLLGTTAYMSPEQAKGKSADRRSDIWAFGVMLFEMLSGKRLFTGETSSDTLAEVLKTEPDFALLPATTPARIRELLARCLKKDPRQRLQSIGDARIAIEETLAGTADTGASAARTDARAKIRERLAWAAAILLLALIAALLVKAYMAHAPQHMQAVRSAILPPPGFAFEPYHFAISPDGSRLAFVALGPDGKDTLWVRPLSSSSAQQLNGTEDAYFPFWSPDNRHIGFSSHGRLKAVDIEGGAAQYLCDLTYSEAFGGTWNSAGTIVFAGRLQGPLGRVADAGGAPVDITRMPHPNSSQAHRWPFFLPDGHHFLYFVDWSASEDSPGNGIYAGSLDSGDSKLVLANLAGNVQFASGDVLYVQDRRLMAQAFDTKRLQTDGTAAPITDQEIENLSILNSLGFSVSQNGMLVFQSATDSPSRLVWYDATGKQLGELRAAGFRDPQLSPDGQVLAAASDDLGNGQHFIRLYDLKRNISTRLTEGGNEEFPIWSHDGKKLAYSTGAGGKKNIEELPVDGSGSPKVLVQGVDVSPDDWSRDGRFLLFTAPEMGHPVVKLYSTEQHQVRSFTDGVEGKFSPDGKWVVHESASHQIVVQAFPGPGPRIEVSNLGGNQPTWSRDGRQIFYIQTDRKLMAVSFDPEKGRAGTPHALFQTRMSLLQFSKWQYTMAPDGRFLINSLPTDYAAPLTLVTNWPALLKKQ
jgi:eukaryotic-like serine/threonine-protein kinase